MKQTIKGEIMNYVIILCTYLLLMSLGRILLFVQHYYLFALIIIFLYTFFIWINDKKNDSQKSSLAFHGIVISIIQYLILSYFKIASINVYYVCYVSVLCVWMFELLLRYRDLCKKTNTNHHK